MDSVTLAQSYLAAVSESPLETPKDRLSSVFLTISDLRSTFQFNCNGSIGDLSAWALSQISAISKPPVGTLNTPLSDKFLTLSNLHSIFQFYLSRPLVGSTAFTQSHDSAMSRQPLETPMDWISGWFPILSEVRAVLELDFTNLEIHLSRFAHSQMLSTSELGISRRFSSMEQCRSALIEQTDEFQSDRLKSTANIKSALRFGPTFGKELSATSHNPGSSKFLDRSNRAMTKELGVTDYQSHSSWLALSLNPEMSELGSTHRLPSNEPYQSTMVGLTVVDRGLYVVDRPAARGGQSLEVKTALISLGPVLAVVLLIAAGIAFVALHRRRASWVPTNLTESDGEELPIDVEGSLAELTAFLSEENLLSQDGDPQIVMEKLREGREWRE
jgi:hypothetical protein